MLDKYRYIFLMLFIFAISYSTYYMYQTTRDYPFFTPENILAGESQNPHQYRVLFSYSYAVLNKLVFNDKELADRMAQLLSILVFYVAVASLLIKVTGSPQKTMIGLLMLLGALSLGMVNKTRNEFYEMAFLALFFREIIRGNERWWIMILLTILGSLNRETYAFILIAYTIHLWSEASYSLNSLIRKKEFINLLLMSAIFIAVFIGLRSYYGLTSYQTDFWTWRLNLDYLSNLKTPLHIWSMGAGLLIIYLGTIKWRMQTSPAIHFWILHILYVNCILYFQLL